MSSQPEAPGDNESFSETVVLQPPSTTNAGPDDAGEVNPYEAIIAEYERKLAHLKAVKDEEIAVKDEEIAVKDEEIAVKNSILGRTYYATIDDVWGPDPIKWNEERFKAAFESLRRKETPSFDERKMGAATEDPLYFAYRLTIAEAMRDDTEATDSPASAYSSHSQSATKKTVWPTDIFGNRVTDSHITHLVPARPTKSSLYVDVAICALPLPDTVSWDVVQKAIHGSKEKKAGDAKIHGSKDEESGVVDEKAGEAKSHGSKDMDAKNPSRTPSTGLKQAVSNKIRLAGQYVYLDQKPCVLIVPVMTVQEMLDWKGGGYLAIVLPGGITSEIVEKTEYQSVALKEEIPSTQVCHSIGMYLEEYGVPDPAKIANNDQVKLALELLRGVVSGMAYSLKCRLEKLEPNLKEKGALENLKNLREDFAKRKVADIIHPCPKIPPCEKPVRVIKFSDHKEDTGHPAPDPLLLLARAGITWSWRQGQKLLVASKEYDDDDESDDELDQLAMEEFLEYQRQLQRPPESPEELALALGQPYGFQKDTRIPMKGQ